MLLSLAACGPKTGGEDTANNPMSLDPKAHMLQVEGKWISQLTGSISEALGAYSAGYNIHITAGDREYTFSIHAVTGEILNRE